MNDKLEPHAAPPPGKRRWLFSWLGSDWLVALFLAAAGFIVRTPALQGRAVWDDDYLIRTNPFIKSPLLILETFRHYLFQDTYSAAYRPVQNISYMADYLFWNTNFYGFHLSSLLFHVAGGVLLYFLLRKLIAPLQAKLSIGQDPRLCSLVAFLVALVWMVHPVHSAAVDYVSGRADSLAFVFACGSWLLFLKGRECRFLLSRVILFILAWSSALLSMCSRESGCIWPLLFLLYLFAFDRSMKSAKKWLIAGFCLTVFAAYIGLRHLPGPAYLPADSSGATAPSLRAVLMLRSLGDQARLMIFPAESPHGAERL